LGEDLGGCLARAVAMLDEATATDLAELGMRAVELPACFVECGQAYHQLGLWELEEEMYVRAAAALEIPVDDAVRPVGVFTRRVLVVNRLEATAALACALVEIGERETARQVAAARLRPTPAERADLPPGWDSEVRAMERLLAVISGDADVGDPASVPADLFDELETSVRTCYRASLLLAAAVGAHDAGAIASAARLADQAVGMLDDYKPSLRTLALRLAAEGAECDDAARRYAQQLALLRWQSRLQVLGSARARRAAALVLREGEQLSRQAYVDALTGLARLRRSDPHDRLGVVLIDVDHFKTINDSFGHAVGDEVLRVIGGALQAAVRASDLAVRLGGDEFMLLLDLKSPTDVAARAHAIVDAVSSHRWGDLAPGLSVTISAGQATGATREVDDVMKAADVNLYRAKAAGRGRAVTAARSRGAVPVRQRAAAREPEVPGTVR
jgi:diguanylate cyclase (GGDEF)-like protein